MPLAELQALFRDMETADLERALRLFTRAFLADEVGLLSVGTDGTPRIYERGFGPDARDPSLNELKGFLAEAPAGELRPMQLRPHWRGIVLAVAGGHRVLCWMSRRSDWSRAQEAGFEIAALHLARSPELREALAGGRDSARLDQRLGDAAQFSGRIAHDFDNILTGVTGFADLSLMLPGLDAQLREFVGEIRAAGTRGLAFTQQLHHLSRSGLFKPVPSSVAEVLRREEARNPAVRVDVAAGLPEVALESGSLQLVLGYLIDNAIEASPKGGAVTVACRLVELSPEQQGDYLGEPGPGPYVEVAVADAGPGVRPDILPKLFHEPFVTTKARHRGLGLPICYRILRVHRAGIRLESPAGRGTTARVVVPLAAARKRNPPAAPEVPRNPGG